MACRLFRKAVQQGRSERRGESYSVPYVEPLSDARTMLADFVNSLLAIPVGAMRNRSCFAYPCGLSQRSLSFLWKTLRMTMRWRVTR
jgi:hypothetical protein